MISSLNIKGYRSIRSAEIQPGRVNIITGPAGHGKTSVVEAVRYVLTGRNQWTDERGCGLDTQVKCGQKRATAALTWADPTGEASTWERTIPAPKGVTALQASIDQVLGLPSAVVAAQLETRRFFHLAAAQQQALLQSVLTADFTMDRLIEEMDKWEPGLGEWFDTKLEAAPESKTLLQYAEIERRAAKKVRDEIAVQIRVKETPTEPPVVGEDEVAALRSQLEGVVSRIGVASGKKDAAQDIWAAEHRAWQAQEQQRRDAEAEVERTTRHLLEVSSRPVPAREGPSEKTLRSQLEAARKRLAEAEEAARANTNSLGDLATAEGPCPAGVCARARLAEYQRAATGAEGAIKVARAEVGRIETAIQHEQEVAFQRSQHDAAVKAAKDAQEAARQRVRALAPLPAEPLRPQAEAVPTGADGSLAQQKAGLEGNLQMLERARAARQAWEAGRSDIAQLRQRLAAEEAQVSRWESAFAALGPTGIKARLMEAGLQQVASDVSGLLGEYFGAHFRIVSDPWAVDVNQGDGWIPVGQVSWSWQARASACLQLVLARRSGFPVVVMDETGADPKVRMDLLALFCDQPGVQSFIISTAQLITTEGEFLRPASDPEDANAGVIFFWVEDGRVEQLQPEMAEAVS